MTTAQIDQIIGWRNYATAQPSGEFPNGSSGFTFSGTASASAYFTAVSSNTTGFLKVSGTIRNGRTDQAVLSRQQLINLQSAIGFSPDVLQYLSTFSREINAPTFSYPTTYSAANDPIANTTNPNVLNLRMASEGSAPDGFTWNEGESVVPRRFSLQRLSLISYDATNTSTISKIYKYFGLIRSSTSGPWTYTGSDGGTSAASEIKTLDQVAAAGREPNFFELLNAAIHRDSIGVSSGFPEGLNGWAGNADFIDGLADLQILRIGANIINQANNDNYPRIISYTPVAGLPLDAYGVVNLPYISALTTRVVLDSFQTWTDPGSADRKMKHQIVPVLWNSHRSLSNTSGPTPSQIEFYVVGRTRFSLRGGNPNTNTPDLYNDSYHYGANSNASRYNEIGLDGFNPSFSSQIQHSQNTGDIVIPSYDFPIYANPSLITGSATGTGSYGPLPYVTGPVVPIFGLTLGNPIDATARAPRNDAAPAAGLPMGSDFPPLAVNPTYAPAGSIPVWNGYQTLSKTTAGKLLSRDWHHNELNPGVNDVGLNAILRYRDNNGDWQVYNAFASNVADRDGKVNTIYSCYGICFSDSATNLATNGVFMWLYPTNGFPCKTGTSIADSSWSLPGGTMGAAVKTSATNGLDNNNYVIMKSDPRTARFGLSANVDPPRNVTDFVRNPLSLDGTNGYYMGRNTNTIASGDTYQVSTSANAYFPGMWAQNVASNGPGTYYFDNAPITSGTVTPGRKGVVRPGDDYLTGVSGQPNTTGASGTNNIYQVPDARPVILNRPFCSVGELGYVFRDMPFKSLDFFTSASVDAALLDFFTVDETNTPFVAGKVNINTRQQPVLASILKGAFRKEAAAGSVTMDPIAANSVAADILAVTGTAPLQNKAELVTKMAKTTSTAFNGDGTATYPSIKTQREAPIRALADVANTRTWNLLIDVIAQTGRYPAKASNLGQFQVEGECRYWLHIAIDRYTGMVVDQYLEPVYE